MTIQFIAYARDGALYISEENSQTLSGTMGYNPQIGDGFNTRSEAEIFTDAANLYIESTYGNQLSQSAYKAAAREFAQREKEEKEFEDMAKDVDPRQPTFVEKDVVAPVYECHRKSNSTYPAPPDLGLVMNNIIDDFITKLYKRLVEESESDIVGWWANSDPEEIAAKLLNLFLRHPANDNFIDITIGLLLLHGRNIDGSALGKIIRNVHQESIKTGNSTDMMRLLGDRRVEKTTTPMGLNVC
jgi:hypothetical protein